MVGGSRSVFAIGYKVEREKSGDAGCGGRSGNPPVIIHTYTYNTYRE